MSELGCSDQNWSVMLAELWLQPALSPGTHADSEEPGMLLCPKGVTFPSGAENRDCLNHGERGGLEQLLWKTEQAALHRSVQGFTWTCRALAQVTLTGALSGLVMAER